MSGKIYLIEGDETFRSLRETPYDSESLLQRLLATHPEVLAGDQIDVSAPRRWLLVEREYGIPDKEAGSDRWALDHLFLDQDGIPTLVEVKHSENTEVRRKVTGQMLDYAANAVRYWPVEKMRASFEGTCEARGEDPATQIAALIEAAPNNETTAEIFWQDVEANLQRGRIRMLFVADYIPTELQRIVEFLNEQMKPAEVLAVEVKQYTGDGDLRTLVPTVIGQTAEAQQRKGKLSQNQTRWNKESFFEALAANESAESVQVAHHLYEWAERKGLRFWWGKGEQEGSFFPILDSADVSHTLFAAWTQRGINIQFQYMKKPFGSLDKRREVQDRLNAIPDVQIIEDNLTGRPSISYSILAEDDDRLETLLRTFDWYIGKLRSTEENNA